MKKVALIFGSIDSEHDISVASATSVFENFPHDRYQCIPIYITKAGTWASHDFSLEDFKNQDFSQGREVALRFDFKNPGFIFLDSHEAVAIDVAFIMLHGRMGEGGAVQGLLKNANIPFTGCDILSSALCMDKGYTHMIAKEVGIPMAKYQLLGDIQEINHEAITYPCIVKPAREGSSFGVSYVADARELQTACETAFTYDRKILIEDYIKGTEVGMAILDTHEGQILSEPDEVKVSGDIFDFQEKYHPHNTQTLEVASYSEALRQQIQTYALRIFEALECRHFARIDFFVDEAERIFFNEINTIPGFTEHSRYPKMIARQGIPYTELIARLISGALYD